jgi:phosphoribosylglycinamide formyltransferase-1
VLNLVVLISGAGSNLRALLEAQGRAFRVAAVGADRDAAGLEHAHEYNVPTFVVDPGDFSSRKLWANALGDKISATTDNPLIVSAGFMRILPEQFVRRFSPRLVNTHPALLPKFPGAHAVRDALAQQATETGVTVHIVDEGVDTGPVIRQERVPILPHDTERELHERIKEREHPLLVRTVNEIARGEIDLESLTLASAH